MTGAGKPMPTCTAAFAGAAAAALSPPASKAPAAAFTIDFIRASIAKRPSAALNAKRNRGLLAYGLLLHFHMRKRVKAKLAAGISGAEARPELVVGDRPIFGGGTAELQREHTAGGFFQTP
jgi:hypothetical protein